MNKFSSYLGSIIREEVQRVLQEDSRGRIVSQLGYPRFVADFFHNLDSKNSYFLADLLAYKAARPLATYFDNFRKWTTAYRELEAVVSGKKVITSLTDENKKAFREMVDIERKRFEDSFFHSLMNFPLIRRAIEGKNVEAIKKFKKSFDEKYDTPEGGGRGAGLFDYIEDELKKQEKAKKVSKFIKFPNGWFWANLGVSKCSDEAEQMGHCGETKRGTLFSLRDPNNKPHITLTYNKDNNVVHEIKGKQNATPDQKYWWALRKEAADKPDGFFDVTGAQLSESYEEENKEEGIWMYLLGDKAGGSFREFKKNLLKSLSDVVYYSNPGRDIEKFMEVFREGKEKGLVSKALKSEEFSEQVFLLIVDLGVGRKSLTEELFSMFVKEGIILTSQMVLNRYNGFKKNVEYAQSFYGHDKNTAALLKLFYQEIQKQREASA